MMKVPVLSSLALALGCASPLVAIERPKSLDEPPEQKPDKVAEVEEMPQVDVPVAPLPWLGVFGEEPSETLRHHLSLEGGVVLRYVAEDSPAAQAGLNAHDILLELDGEQLNSQADLRTAVSRRQPGDKVAVSVVSKGVRSDKEVTLGERPPNLGPPMPQQHFGMRGNFDLKDFPNIKRLRGIERLFPGGFGDLDQKEIDRMRAEVEEQLRELEELPGMELDIEDMLKAMPKIDGDFNMSLRASSSITLMDEDGSVEMKVRDGGKEVIVRDLEGEIVYEGPWDTEQDRAAVAPEIRERIEKLNFDGKGSTLRFQFDAPKNEPAEPGEGE